MQTPEQWINKYRSRLAWGQFLKQAADWLAGFLLVFGLLVITAKLFVPALWPHVLWLGLGAIPVTWLAWNLSRREWFSRSESVALLDKKLNAGGLLLTLYETSGPNGQIPAEWEEKLPRHAHHWESSLPKFRPWRFLKLLVFPLIFAVSAGFVPLKKDPPPVELQNTVGEEVTGQLEQMLEELEKEQVVEEEEAKELKEEIEKLKEEVKKTPLTHEKWETVDAIREKLRRRMDAAQLQVSKALAATVTLQKGGQGEQVSKLDQDRVEQLKKDIAQVLQKFNKGGQLNENDLQRLQKALQEMAENGQLERGELDLPTDPQEREEFLKELEEHLKQQCDKLSELRKKCQGGMCPGGMCQGDGWNELMKELEGQGAGRGGLTRGPGHAPLNFGEESDIQEKKFKSVVMPPGFKDQPTDDVIRITSTDPEVAPAESAPRNARREETATSGSETWNRDVRPSVQRVVKQYFDTKE